MKKIEVVVKPFKVEEIREALDQKQIPNLTLLEMKRFGQVKQYRGATYLDSTPNVRVEVIVEDDQVSEVVDIVTRALRTGYLCDGEIVILPVKEVIRIRVGERC